jgi:hypothetical protein
LQNIEKFSFIVANPADLVKLATRENAGFGRLIGLGPLFVD